MFLALRELKYAKFRFFMIGMILVLISWLVFILSGLGNGLSSLSAAVFKNMDADYVVFEEGARHSMLRSVISENLVKDLKDQKDVLDAAPMGVHTAVVLKEDISSDDEKIDVSLIGIHPGTFLEPETIEGDVLTEGKDHEVIVDASLKDSGIQLGDTLEIEGTTQTIKVVGFVENQSFNHLPAIFMTLDMWREIHFAAPGSDRGINKPVNAIMLQGENISPEEIDQSMKGIETATKQEAIKGVPGYTAENGTIMMMLTFLLAISAVVVTVFFYVITLQKSNQFGIMKAIGASNSFLGRAVVSQVFLLAATSIGLGIILTFGTAAIFPQEMPFALDPMLLITYAIVLLLVSVLSSLLSVRKITKIDPLQAMRRIES